MTGATSARPTHPSEMTPLEEHAVIVYFEYAADSLAPLFEMEEKLEEAVDAARVGEFERQRANRDERFPPPGSDQSVSTNSARWSAGDDVDFGPAGAKIRRICRAESNAGPSTEHE